jgi:hypothetical protein
LSGYNPGVTPPEARMLLQPFSKLTLNGVVAPKSF